MGVSGRVYRAAIVGLGRIASKLEDDELREKPASHAGALTGNPRCELVAGLDNDASRREEFARRWGVSEVTDSMDRLLKTRPDIVVVATHADTHRPYAEASLRGGVPMVICEKPLANTMRDAKGIAAAARRFPASRVIVNHERRYSRDYRLVRSAVAEQRFGRLLSVYGTLYFGNRARHRDVLRHDGTHLVDAVNFVCTDTVVARKRVGSLRRRLSSSFLHGTLQRSGVPVVIEIGSERTYLQFDMILSFAAGRIHLGNGRFVWEESLPSHHYGGYRSLLNRHRTVPEPTNYFAGMVADAVACLDDRTKHPVSTAEDALAAMRVIRSLPVLL